jgi:two-component system response regulator MprA
VNILLVEDDAQIAKFIRQGLKEEGHTVRHIDRGDEAVDAARQTAYDAIVLDVMLPGRDGLTVCRDLRAIQNRTPVLMLTARDSVEDRVAGLDAGADDYLVKPFAFEELLARLRAMERRRTEFSGAGPALECHGLTLDLLRHRARFGEKTIELSSREFALLHLFLKRRGQVLTRTVILEAVWGYDFETGTNVVDVYVNYLRQKLAAAGVPCRITTLRGRGYMFEPADE